MKKGKIKISTKKLCVFYNEKQALFDVNISINERETTALIGPSGCGKSSLLRCFNRMNDIIENCLVTGNVDIDNIDINAPNIDIVRLRTRVGMVFQKPNPFPKSIFDNISYLWDEVKARLNQPGTSLSGGQQQRLCIARAIAVKPEIILMDEPCSALDPIATATIEELMDELKKEFTIVIVTHNMQQAARVSQKTAFFHLGSLIELGPTEQIFTNPTIEKTQDYITGRFG